jgi:hypothetical protein
MRQSSFFSSIGLRPAFFLLTKNMIFPSRFILFGYVMYFCQLIVVARGLYSVYWLHMIFSPNVWEDTSRGLAVIVSFSSSLGVF